MKEWYSSSELCELIKGTLIGSHDVLVKTVSDFYNNVSDAVCFINDEKYFSQLKNLNSKILIVDKNLEIEKIKKNYLKENNAIISSANAFSHFVDLMYLLEPKLCNPFSNDDIKEASISNTVKIFPNSFIDKDVIIDEGTIVFPGAVVLRGSVIGKNCKIFPNVSILHNTVLGNNVIIGAGSVLGYDGFGYIDDTNQKKKIPHIGRVFIEDDVEIGANTCIDRGTISDTIIKHGTKVDNLVHIAHNCIIGSNTIICGMTGLCGNTTIGDNVIMAAKSGTKGHLSIGDSCVVAARTSVTKDLKKGSFVKGYPARPINEELKIQTLIGKLPEIYDRLKELERRQNDVNNK